MDANSFMNVRTAKQFFAQSKAIVVFIVLMALKNVRQNRRKIFCQERTISTTIFKKK
jgi:hypothetical protein